MNAAHLYRAFAADYDGTLAHEGKVPEPVPAALERLRLTGIKLVLVTGRQLPDLKSVFPQLGLFDRVVVENGAVIYRPADASERLLAEPPPDELIRRLSDEGVALASGRVIIATRRPYDLIASAVIRDMSLSLRIIFNKEAVMILPLGVDKRSGLQAALEELDASWEETAGIGDAENDEDFLSRCGLAVAVANALPSVRRMAHMVTERENGAGVVEAIERIEEGIEGG